MHVEHCRTSASALLGTSILDSSGKTFGRVKEFAVLPQQDATRVAFLVVRRTGAGRGESTSLVPVASLERDPAGQLKIVGGMSVKPMSDAEDYLLLDRDLLDQQIIDIHGHKVVRVNDVDMVWENCALAELTGQPVASLQMELRLRIAEVEVGMRGALRRLLKGLPNTTVEGIASRVRPSIIPWDFVDLIDRDPSRRVRLKIEQEQLARMHPSDLADILEELAPKEGQALFESLDEEVAAEALEEVDVQTQKQLLSTLDSETIAGIIEEMDPSAAADLLSELSDERSDAILEEMSDEGRHDVEQLLDYEPDSAAGLMTTQFLTVPDSATVGDAIAALQAFDDPEAITDIFVLGPDQHLAGVVPLSRLLLTESARPLATMHEGRIVSSVLNLNGRKVAELFDKYNLRCLPVLDDEHRVAGVIHAEHVIAWLRTEK